MSQRPVTACYKGGFVFQFALVSSGAGVPAGVAAGRRSPTRSRSHPPDGRRECRLGRTEDPRRPSKARFRGVGTNRGSVSPPDTPPRGSGQKLVGLLGEPSRGDRCLRLLHRTHGDVQAAVRLLRHRAWAKEDPAHQRNSAPDRGLGSPTVTRSVSRGWSASLRDLGPRFAGSPEICAHLQLTALSTAATRASALPRQFQGRVPENGRP